MIKKLVLALLILISLTSTSFAYLLDSNTYSVKWGSDKIAMECLGGFVFVMSFGLTKNGASTFVTQVYTSIKTKDGIVTVPATCSGSQVGSPKH